MGVEPTLRPYGPEDLTGVLAVLKAALGETPTLQRTPALWAWKHELNPFGPSLVWVAEVEDRIVGVRALMRWDLQLGPDTRLRCLRAVDTATHPDYERRGIFRRLTTALVEQAREEGYHMIFNTPNDRSAPGYLSMGWNEVGKIGVMVKPLLHRGIPVDGEALPQPADFFEPEPAALANSDLESRPSDLLRTPRTASYLSWRFTSHPFVPYRAVAVGRGVAVVRPNIRNLRKEVVLSDLLGLPNRRLVKAVTSSARASYIVGWFSPKSPERRVARAGGMLPVPGMHALTLVANPLQELPVNVFQASNWDLAMSDLELL